MKNNLLQIDGLTKKYGNTVTVDHISFSIEKGEVLGLLGPNGAGKSTIVLMLTTYLESNEGSFLLDGISPKDKAGREQIKKKIGYVPQEIALYEDMNPVENLMFFGKMYKLPTVILRKRVDDILEQVGLQDRRKQPVKQFSGGMKRRLNIAAALLHEPQLVILDEPTVGIDPQSRNRIFDVIKSLRDKGVSVLYITHYMEEAELLCDYVAIIDQGHIIANDTVANLIETSAMEHVIEVETECTEDALCVLQNQYGTEKLTYHDGSLCLMENNVGNIVPDFLNKIYQTGCIVKKVEIREPSLQHVFLQMTGKELRD